MTKSHIPAHVGFIMDGNRRWAKEHRMVVALGHERGGERIERIVEYAAKKGVKVVTFWAFSTENWNRGKLEIEILFRIFRNFLKSEMVARLIRNGVKLQIIGEYKAFPNDIVTGLEKLLTDSRDNTRITAIIALNYGGRAEIIRAVNALLKVKEEIDEQTFSHYLYTAGQPDPDLIIRTGGEQRLSGFLPWQGVYSELYFTDVYWPDFDEKEFDKALEVYAGRERRFGK